MNRLFTLTSAEKYGEAVNYLCNFINSAANSDMDKNEAAANLHYLLNQEKIQNRFTPDQLMEYNNILNKYHLRAAYSEGTKNEIGTAPFIEVDQINQTGQIRFLKTAESASPSYSFALDQTALRYCLKYVQGEIQQHIKSQNSNEPQVPTILNWGIDLTLAPHLLSHMKYAPVESVIVPISGSSHHFAAVASFVSGVIKKPVPFGYIFSGGFSNDGGATGISDLKLKIEVILKEWPSFKKLFLPSESEISSSDKEILESRGGSVIYISSFHQLVKEVFNSTLNDLLIFNTEELKKLGRARIFQRSVDENTYKFLDDCGGTIEKKVKVLVLDFQCSKFSREEYQIFPISLSIPAGEFDCIIFNGIIPNHYTGYIMSNIFKQAPSCFGIRTGANTNKVFIFSALKKHSDLLGRTFEFDFSQYDLP